MTKILQEFMVVGLDGETLYPNSNLLQLHGEEAKIFLNGERSEYSREYFLQTHGIRPFPKSFFHKMFNYPYEFLIQAFDKQIPVHEIISKMIKNHPTESFIPVVHLLTCFSGAAQDHLAKVSGDVILCTYTHPTKVSIGAFSQSFIKLGTNADTLTKYINDNFYLCAAVNFTIGCKIGNKIFKHHIKSELVTAITDVDERDRRLKKEKMEFQQFCQYLNKTFKKKLP